MAVEFANETTKRAETLYSDWPENILVEPELNGRHINTDVESLAADIEAHGQEQPVGCSKNDDGQPVLRFGHRWYRSIVLLNKKNPDARRFVAQRAALQELAPEAAQTVRDGRVKLTAAVALAKLTKTQQRERVAGSGKIKGADVKREAPAPVTKPAPNSLKKALAALIAECKQQGETMVFEIRCETIAAIRAAL